MKKLISIFLIISILISGCSSSFDDTDYGYYYQQLSTEQKKIYVRMLQATENYQDKIWMNEDYDTIRRAIVAFTLDQPQYFWYCKSDYFYRYLFDFVFYVDFSNDDTEILESDNTTINQIIDQIISETQEMNDYDTLKYFHDYIILNTSYQLESSNSQDIRSVFLSHSSVCAGYAKAFQLLANKAGYECYYVSGYTSDNPDDAHAWNIVKLDGQYYNVDCTFDEIIDENDNEYGVRYDYFLVSDEYFSFNHIPDDRYYFTYPTCNDNSYNFFLLNDCFFKTYNMVQITNYIIDKLNQGTDKLYLKFENEQAYNSAISDLFMKKIDLYGTRFNQIVRQNYDNSRSMTYTLLSDPETYSIMIYNINFKN